MSKDRIVQFNSGILCIYCARQTEGFFIDRELYSIDCHFGGKMDYKDEAFRFPHIEMSREQVASLTYHLLQMCQKLQIEPAAYQPEITNEDQ